MVMARLFRLIYIKTDKDTAFSKDWVVLVKDRMCFLHLIGLSTYKTFLTMDSSPNFMRQLT